IGVHPHSGLSTGGPLYGVRLSARACLVLRECHLVDRIARCRASRAAALSAFAPNASSTFSVAARHATRDTPGLHKHPFACQNVQVQYFPPRAGITALLCIVNGRNAIHSLTRPRAANA